MRSLPAEGRVFLKGEQSAFSIFYKQLFYTQSRMAGFKNTQVFFLLRPELKSRLNRDRSERRRSAAAAVFQYADQQTGFGKGFVV